jgi:hypothetical protein
VFPSSSDASVLFWQVLLVRREDHAGKRISSDPLPLSRRAAPAPTPGAGRAVAAGLFSGGLGFSCAQATHAPPITTLSGICTRSRRPLNCARLMIRTRLVDAPLRPFLFTPRPGEKAIILEKLFLRDGFEGDSWTNSIGRRICPVAWSPSTPRAL